jgi:manganese transport protein
VLFTADRRLMGPLANRRITTAAVGLVAGLVVAMDLYLIYRTFTGG